eukprot:TRINITY_DN208_c0_g1_i1.p1 TRINITY_DN208_c0_g1~~TRINITY_DN208_c0_g1_i1.p1  ORF type:complete len:336 (+),score=104.55 TRINITY_DN208_c0_g1_i1:108-1115(+)
MTFSSSFFVVLCLSLSSIGFASLVPQYRPLIAFGTALRPITTAPPALVSEEDVVFAVKQTLSNTKSHSLEDDENALNVHLQHAQPLDVLALFLFPEMSSSSLSLQLDAYSPKAKKENNPSFIQSLLSSSSSSIFSSSMYCNNNNNNNNNECSLSLEERLQELKPIVLDNENGCASIASLLNSKQSSSLFSNQNGQKTHLLIIKMSAKKSFEENDLCIQQISSLLQSRSQANRFVALITANKPLEKNIHVDFNDKPQPMQAIRSFENTAAPLTSTSSSNTTNTTDEGITRLSSIGMLSLLIGFFMIIVAAIGISCVAGIETPVRWSTRPIPIGKEY